MPHPLFTVLTALLLAMSMAAVENRSTRRRVRAAARFLLSSIAAVIGGGWLMRIIHG